MFSIVPMGRNGHFEYFDPTNKLVGYYQLSLMGLVLINFFINERS